MLTSNLLRARVGKLEVRPAYVPTDDAELSGLAETLIQIFQRHEGQPRHELETELKELLGSGTEFLLHRGLAKLLEDRCEFETATAIDPPALRAAVFAEAARFRQANHGQLDLAQVLEHVSREFAGSNPSQLQHALYGDLKAEQHLQRFRKVTPSWLLKRYNVALAQAVLFKAVELEVQIRNKQQSRYRELFRRIKFFQLMYQVKGNVEEGYEIHLDGPMSLFKSCQKYGLQMANFLPTLLHCDEYSLTATVQWGKARLSKQFHLAHTEGLEPYGHLPGQWQPAEMQFLKERFAKLKTEWVLQDDPELIDLAGQGVLVPDYVFVHKPTGKRVLMEIFGFWRKGSLASRIKLLKEHGPPNVLLALSQELHVEEEQLEDLPQEVYVFRSVPIARDVLARLDQMLGTLS